MLREDWLLKHGFEINIDQQSFYDGKTYVDFWQLDDEEFSDKQWEDLVIKIIENKNMTSIIDELVEELNGDQGYRISWRSNIAMAFFDEYFRYTEHFHSSEIEPDKKDIHTIANNAAENFLKQLCS